MTKLNNFSESANDSLQISASANEKGIQIFNNQEFGNVRVIIKGDEPMFCLSDICKAVGLKNPSSVKSRLDPQDLQLIDLHALKHGEGEIIGNSMANFVNESGFYDVLLFSDSSNVRPFRKWVTSEVLPSIRKQGGYMIAKENETPEELMARALMIAQETLKRKEQRLLEAEAKIKADAPKVEFYDAVTDSKDAIDMRVVATTLNMGVGRNKIFEILRKENILDRKNIPYQRYIDNGYFRTVETSYSKPDGTQCINIKTVVFQKGLDFIRKVVEKNIKR